MQAVFQDQPPPPGAVTVLARSFIEAGEGGFANTFVLLAGANDQNVRRELGLTDAEVANINVLTMQLALQAPQYAQRFRTMTEETRQDVQNSLVRDMGRITRSLSDALPPERHENVQRFLFQAAGGIDSPLITLHSMEALNLSEEQKTRMRGIFDEVRAERLAPVERALEMIEKVIAAGGPENLSEEEREELEREGRELQGHFENQMWETSRRLADRLRQQLTPEQLELERQLMASRPNFLGPLPPQMQRDRADAEAETVEPSESDFFIPGDDSWRPGDALPIQWQPPPSRFPRPR